METESILENLLFQSSLDQQEFQWKELDRETSEDLVIASSFLNKRNSFRNSISAQTSDRLSLVRFDRSASTSKPNQPPLSLRTSIKLSSESPLPSSQEFPISRTGTNYQSPISYETFKQMLNHSGGLNERTSKL